MRLKFQFQSPYFELWGISKNSEFRQEPTKYVWKTVYNRENKYKQEGESHV